MKILFFSENLHSGGKERRIVELIKELSKYKRYEIELVLTRKNIHYEEIERYGTKIHYLERKIWKKDPSVFLRFFLLAKKFNPDCIHVWGRMVAIYAIPTARLLNIPLINSEITDAPEGILPPELSLRLTMKYSDCIIANSGAGIKAYGAPQDKSTVIHNGFDFSRLDNLQDKKTIRRELGVTTEFVVIMIGTYYYKKDYPTFLKAAEMLLNKRRDITFIGMGSGDPAPYRGLIQEKNRDRIKLMPSRQNVEEVMNIADIGVLATFTEGISNSILEFMALSKPVVVTGKGGCEELVMNDENGFLYDPGNYGKMADQINILLDDMQTRYEFGKRSREIVAEEFSQEKMIEKFIEIYSSYAHA